MDADGPPVRRAGDAGWTRTAPRLGTQGITQEELVVLGWNCVDHIVARCPQCDAALAGSQVGGDSCPACSADVTQVLRLHILGCEEIESALREHINRGRAHIDGARAHIDASRALRARSDALRARSDAIAAESKALVARTRRTFGLG